MMGRGPRSIAFIDSETKSAEHAPVTIGVR